MTSSYKTEQEKFWAEEFGNEYISRNNDSKLLAANLALFSKVFDNINQDISSLLELGCNIGLNLKAIKDLLPETKLVGIDINKSAIDELKNDKRIETHCCPINSFNPKEKFDFVFAKTVLIHINPDDLDQVYQKMYDLSNKFILIAEYYNPTPVSILYRGHQNKLFKRDFAGEMMDKFPDLKLVDYGFFYNRDKLFSQDDITYFLLSK